jgi:hypothetical protein
LVALAVGLASAAYMPPNVAGIVAAHQVRWLWPLAVFITFAVVLAFGRRARWFGVAALAATVLLALLNLPVARQHVGPPTDRYAMDVVRDLRDQMATLEDRGTLLFDTSELRFAEPYSGPVMDELQRRGIEFRVEDEGMVRQVGEHRRFDDDTEARLFIRQGGAALAEQPGATRVALASGLTGEEQEQLDGLRSLVAGTVEDTGVPLNELGEAQLDAGNVPVLGNQLDTAPALDGEALVASGVLAAIVDAGYVDLDALDDATAELLARYAALERRFDRETVALFLAPMGA